MLRIGIDLTSLPSLKGGVAFYLLELVKALSAIDFVNRYDLLVRDVHCGEMTAIAPRFDVRGFRLTSRPLRLAWEQIALPGVARQLRLDVLHSPHYTRPLSRLACASVVGIMDMTLFLLPQHHVWEKRVFFQRAIPTSVRRADRLIAISESTKRDLQEHLDVAGDRIDVTPLAVSRDYRPDIALDQIEAVRQHYDLPQRFLLFVGRLEPRKNLPALLDAYVSVLERSSNTPPLVLAGAKGWHSEALMARLDGLSPKVRTLGYVPETDLPALYAASTAFVYPSLYEGFGIPVLEALSCGVPTITSNVSSMPEVAGDAALLVDPRDIGALADAMTRLLSDPDLRQDLRRRGLQRAAEFSWERTAALTVESYLKAHEQWRRGSES